MVKITALLFVIIAPTLAGILMVVVLSMASPADGGTVLGQQGMTLLLVVLGAVVVSLPISYVVASKINRAIST